MWTLLLYAHRKQIRISLDRKRTRLSNRGKRNYTARLHVCETTAADYYSTALRDFAVSRREWLIKEYLDGRINEKQFLEAVLIQAPSITEKGLHEMTRIND